MPNNKETAHAPVPAPEPHSEAKHADTPAPTQDTTTAVADVDPLTADAVDLPDAPDDVVYHNGVAGSRPVVDVIGATGEDVRGLQGALVLYGYAEPDEEDTETPFVTGFYDQRTQDACVKVLEHLRDAAAANPDDERGIYVGIRALAEADDNDPHARIDASRLVFNALDIPARF